MNKIRVLIVDNDSEYRQSLRQFLESENFFVIESRSVVEALEGLGTLFPDLILIDLKFTDESGLVNEEFLFTEKIRQKQIPCIIITGSPSYHTSSLVMRGRGGQPLAVDYIPKIYGFEPIKESILGILGMTILHISDLHRRETEDMDEKYDQDEAFRGFIGDVEKQAGLALNTIKAIIVSGDISYRFQKKSFDKAVDFLKYLAKELNVPMNQIVLVPGNHDINRSKGSSIHNHIDAMKNGNDKWFDKFDEYLEFTRLFYGEPAFSIDKLYRLFIVDSRLAIIAFNSCLVEGDPSQRCSSCKNKEHYYGWINRDQVRQAGEELDDLNWHETRIATFHHHIEDLEKTKTKCHGDHLRNYNQYDQRLKFTLFENGFRLLLHGHRHKGILGQSPTFGANEPYHFGSGAFWIEGYNERENASYLLLQLSPLNGKSRVIMRRYNPGTNSRSGYWGTDDSIQPDGIVSLPVYIRPLGPDPLSYYSKENKP